MSTILIVALVAIPLILILVAVASFAFVQFDTRAQKAETTKAKDPTSKVLRDARSKSPGVLP